MPDVSGPRVSFAEVGMRMVREAELRPDDPDPWVCGSMTPARRQPCDEWNKLSVKARVGGCVCVHAGFAISVVGEARALESLRLVQGLLAGYSAQDLVFSTGDLPVELGSELHGRQLPAAD